MVAAMADASRSPESLPRRTLRTGGWLACFATLVFVLQGWWAVAMGAAIGSALSLFSLWSVAVVMPALLRPGNRRAQFWLAAMLFVKFPLYAGVLYWATLVLKADVFALFGGIALVPVVIVLKIVGQQILDGRKAAMGD